MKLTSKLSIIRATDSEDSSRIQYGLSLVALSMASSGRDFDPRTRAFSDEELKPQPMIKKSRKQVSPVSRFNNTLKKKKRGNLFIFVPPTKDSTYIDTIYNSFLASRRLEIRNNF